MTQTVTTLANGDNGHKQLFFDVLKTDRSSAKLALINFWP